MAGQVRIAADGGISRVTLSHAGKLNAMSRAMWRELSERVREHPARRERALRDRRGRGRAFLRRAATSPSTRRFASSEQGCATFTKTMSGADSTPCCAATCPSWRRSRATAWAPAWKLPAAATSGWPAHRRSSARRLPARLSDGAARGETGGEALGGLTAREMLLEAAVLDAPTMLLRGFLKPRADRCRRGRGGPRARAAHRRTGPAGRAPEQTDVSGLESAESQRRWIIKMLWNP
jgi:hypothetical protein